jgi:ribonuclease VapC
MTVVLDTSAVLAVVFGEDDAEALLAAMLHRAGDLQISAGTLVETGIVVEARHGPQGADDLRILLDRLGVEAVQLDEEQARLAVAAWRRFGKGRHPAGLNLGDCLAYALAKALSAPLLFKGTDFAQTDVASAL